MWTRILNYFRGPAIADLMARNQILRDEIRRLNDEYDKMFDMNLRFKSELETLKRGIGDALEMVRQQNEQHRDTKNPCL